MSSAMLTPIGRSRPFTTKLHSTKNLHQRAVMRPAAEPGATPTRDGIPAEGRCPTCGVPRNEMSLGCDGSGRIAGGIGAVPGFGWWPIKAYRPCGKATAAGIAYVRKGQIIDEVLFGKSDKRSYY